MNLNDKIIKNEISKKSFHFNDIIIEINDKVYDPCEDTFLLIESIRIKKNDFVFEIGTGCGIISLECARIGAKVISSDINPYAIQTAKKNFFNNMSKLKGKIEFRQGDLFSVLKKDEKFDVIIFNPPYLPTKPKDKIGKPGWIDIALNGGYDGLQLTKRFIKSINIYLKKTGIAYFVFSSLSDRDVIENYISKFGLDFEIIKSYHFDDETIDSYSVFVPK